MEGGSECKKLIVKHEKESLGRDNSQKRVFEETILNCERTIVLINLLKEKNLGSSPSKLESRPGATNSCTCKNQLLLILVILFMVFLLLVMVLLVMVIDDDGVVGDGVVGDGDG